MVSATLVRAPLSCSRGTVRACQFFSFAMRYYTVLTLLILLLEMYANYDVTEVSVGHRIWIIRAVSYELLSFGQFGVWGKDQNPVFRTFSLFSQLAAQMSTQDWIWKGTCMMLLWLIAINSVKKDVPMTTIVIFLHTHQKHFTIQAFGKYGFDLFLLTVLCFSRANLRSV